MTPEATAAHAIAKALKTVQQEWGYLDAESRKALSVAFSLPEPTLANGMGILAAMLERKHPFVPVSAAQRSQLVDELADCVSDLTRHEIAAEILNADSNTEAEWRMLADEKIDNLRFDMEHEDDPDVKAEYAQQIADFEALATQE